MSGFDYVYEPERVLRRVDELLAEAGFPARDENGRDVAIVERVKAAIRGHE